MQRTFMLIWLVLCVPVAWPQVIAGKNKKTGALVRFLAIVVLFVVTIVMLFIMMNLEPQETE